MLALAMLGSLSACGLHKLKDIELPPLPDLKAGDEQAAATDKPIVIETPLPNVLPTITPTESPVQETLPVQAELPTTPNQVIINFRHTSYENFDPEEGTQRILTFTYDTPIVTMEDRLASANAINSQLSLLDETYYMGDENVEGSFGYNGMLEMAEDNYAYVRQSGNAGMPTEYSSSRTAATARVDDQLINIIYTYYDYTGGAHGNYAQEAFVFDAYNGERLQLEDLTSNYPALRDCIIYYMGPSPAREGRPIGSAGPTTASRMDKYAPTLLDLGERAMVGKGKRTKEVLDAVVRDHAVYFAAIGGAGALLSQCIKKSEVIAYEDLGAEAIRLITVEDFPVIVVADDHGNNLYATAQAQYKR